MVLYPRWVIDCGFQDISEQQKTQVRKLVSAGMVLLLKQCIVSQRNCVHQGQCICMQNYRLKKMTGKKVDRHW